MALPPPTQCTAWAGLPNTFSEPMPHGCGVFWFLHIGKTGGTTVTDHLRAKASATGWVFTELFDLDKGFDYQGWNATDGWHRVEREFAKPAPRIIVAQHHTSPGFATTIVPQVLTPWRAILQAKGCRLATATVLREPVERMQSNLGYNEIPTEDFEFFISDHSNFMARYIVNTVPYAYGQPFDAFRDQVQFLKPALWALTEMDLVGRTRELTTFLSHVDHLLGWSHGASGAAPQHSLATKHKISLSPAQIRYIRERSQVDEQLYGHYCRVWCNSATCDPGVIAPDYQGREYSCGARMDWLRTSKGGGLSEEDACQRVGTIFWEACGGCASPHR